MMMGGLGDGEATGEETDSLAVLAAMLSQEESLESKDMITGDEGIAIRSATPVDSKMCG